MPREIDLNVGQSTLRLLAPQCPNTVNDERVLGDWFLKALFPAPYLHRLSQRPVVSRYVGYHLQVMLKRHKGIQ
jgi:hypothetical protein